MILLVNQPKTKGDNLMPTLAAWINTLSPEQIAKEIAKAQAENAAQH